MSLPIRYPATGCRTAPPPRPTTQCRSARRRMPRGADRQDARIPGCSTTSATMCRSSSLAASGPRRGRGPAAWPRSAAARRRTRCRGRRTDRGCGRSSLPSAASSTTGAATTRAASGRAASTAAATPPTPSARSIVRRCRAVPCRAEFGGDEAFGAHQLRDPPPSVTALGRRGVRQPCAERRRPHLREPGLDLGAGHRLAAHVGGDGRHARTIDLDRIRVVDRPRRPRPWPAPTTRRRRRPPARALRTAPVPIHRGRR